MEPPSESDTSAYETEDDDFYAFMVSMRTESDEGEKISEVPLFRFEVCKLFGIIQSASVSLDPGSQQYGSVNIFNQLKITAPLYVTTDKVDDMERYRDYYLQSDDDEDYGDEFEEQSDLDLEDTFVETAKLIHKERITDNYVFEICNDSAFINLSDYFSKKPDGGSGCYISKGKDGYLELHYVALKYAVDAALEVEFVATCTYEFFVPRDGRSAFGSILSDDCSLNLKVEWKLPSGA
nr:aminoacyl-tRNA synthetase, class 1a, anticodon-binding [Tanacetum cinerariifolium]